MTGLGHSGPGSRQETSLPAFFGLVLALSIPFWLVGATTEPLPKVIPPDLPISSLMAVCPMLAALILVHRKDQTSGIRTLLRRIFDYKRIDQKIWYVPVIVLMPMAMAVTYAAARLIGVPLPPNETPFLTIWLLILLPLLCIGAVTEEAGWSGYATDPMQDHWGALKASIILGSFWAVWHIVPYLQAGRSAAWIAAQCAVTVGLRVLIVWLYNNAGSGVFAAALFHAVSNVSQFLFPGYSSPYVPAIAAIVIAAVAAITAFVWGPRTLAQFRYA